MLKVGLMTIWKSGGYIPLLTAWDFNTTNNAYYIAENKRPSICVDTNQFIIYLDITKLYPIQTEYIDGLDFTKIHLTLQPKPPRVAPLSHVASTGLVSANVACLAAAIEQQYKDDHDLKEETLVLYNVTTGSVTPQECIN